MNGKAGKKAAILLVAGLMTAMSGITGADHDTDLVTPLVALFAVGALVNYDRASHHYHHYYSYRRYGHYRGHYSRPRYHGYRHQGRDYYRKRQSSHGHYAKPQRRNHSQGGYRRY